MSSLLRERSLWLLTLATVGGAVVGRVAYCESYHRGLRHALEHRHEAMLAFGRVLDRTVAMDAAPCPPPLGIPDIETSGASRNPTWAPAGHAQTVTQGPADLPGSEEAYASGQRLVSAALAAQVWGQSDAGLLHNLIPLMTRDQRKSLRRQVIDALNNGQMRTDLALPF